MFSQPGYGAPDDEAFVSELEGVHSAQALWTRSRSDVEDEEYKEFSTHISHDFEDPLSCSHHRGDGTFEYPRLSDLHCLAPSH